MDFFSHVTLAAPDAVFGLNQAIRADPRPGKVNLTVGLYRTETLTTPVLNCVKKAEKELLISEKSKEYLPLDGDKEYLECAGELLFGENVWPESKERIAKVQTVGGTSALRVGGELFLREKIGDSIYLPDATWPNHRNIFTSAGLKVEIYPYYDRQKQTLEFQMMCAYLEKLAPRSIVLLHACCQNPTGADLDLDQWEKLSVLMLKKRLIPFFDMAYQGFGHGVARDADSVRLFAREGHEMLVAYSFSKNFSLYAERVGALFAVCDSHKESSSILSRMITTIRPNYSNPPQHGARVVATILQKPELKKEWEKELDEMRTRVQVMRAALVTRLNAKATKGDFDFLNRQLGLFSFSGLSSLQVDRLIKEYAIYMTSDGRINMAGLNWDNIDYVVDSILAVL